MKEIHYKIAKTYIHLAVHTK